MLYTERTTRIYKIIKVTRKFSFREYVISRRVDSGRGV